VVVPPWGVRGGCTACAGGSTSPGSFRFFFSILPSRFDALVCWTDFLGILPDDTKGVFALSSIPLKGVSKS
jgi:hypothetical protein